MKKIVVMALLLVLIVGILSMAYAYVPPVFEFKTEYALYSGSDYYYLGDGRTVNYCTSPRKVYLYVHLRKYGNIVASRYAEGYHTAHGWTGVVPGHRYQFRTTGYGGLK